jgi:small-conductance mechanosensitive channel
MTRFLTLLGALALSALVAFSGALSVQGQGQNGLDYSGWENLASRAETAVDQGRVSTGILEELRAEISQYRQRFLAATEANKSRIETVEQQIEALGPQPENGDEADGVAQRRTELNNQLNELRAPGLVAEEAFKRANGLVSEIDAIISDRQAQEVLALGSSPLNPAYWGEAVTELAASVERLSSETVRNFRNPTARAQMQSDAPLTVLFLGLALVLLTRGRRWAERFGNYLRGFGGRGTGIWSFVVSLGRVVLPVLGLVFLAEAVQSTALLGPRGTEFVANLPEWGAVLLFLRWLCEQLFAKRDEDALVLMTAEQRAEMRFYGTLLAVLYVARDVLALLMEEQHVAEAGRAVVNFPVTVLAGLVLLRMGQFMLTRTNAEGEEIAPGGAGRVLRLLGRASLAVAVATPVLAAIGYTNLAHAVLYPFIMSLAVLGVALVVNRFLADVYCVVTKQGEDGREALIPVLMGFGVFALSVPVLALVWGVRPAQLLELWTQFLEGFQLGETRISPTDFILFAAIFAAGYTATRLLQGALRTNLLPKTKIDPGGQTAIVSGLGYIGIFIAALVAISGAGIDLSALAFVAGALSVGIGFGLQNIVSNFVSGIILLIERPISEGDWIEVGGHMGYVRDISVRSTRIETFDRSDVIIPNGDLVSGTVTNFTRGNTVGRLIVPVGVAYGTDTHRVEKILQEIAEKHPLVMQPPTVVFQGFGADSLDFEIRAILRDVNWMLSVKSEMNHEIAKRFVEEGIEIPYAQRDIWLRNPEALAVMANPAPKDDTDDDAQDTAPTEADKE